MDERMLSSIKPEGPIMSHQMGEIFLKVISVACEALIACSRQLDTIAQHVDGSNYGSSLARGVTAIKYYAEEKKIVGRSPFVAFTQIKLIFESTAADLHGKLYSIFFDAAAKAFLKYEKDDQITVSTWLNVLTAANNAISEITKPSEFDGTMLSATIPAQFKLEEALENRLDPIQAFGEAVKAAENSSKVPGRCFAIPAAHAVGIWMRGAYEATKLRLNFDAV